MATGASTPKTLLTTSDEPTTGPRATVSRTLLSVLGVRKDHDGRSPPGAEITIRSRVPARKTWPMGSIGIRTSV